MPFLSSVLIPIVQASSFSLLPYRPSTSDLSIYQLWKAGVWLFPFPGPLIEKSVLSPHSLCSALGLAAVCCILQYLCTFALCRCCCSPLHYNSNLRPQLKSKGSWDEICWEPQWDTSLSGRH